MFEPARNERLWVLSDTFSKRRKGDSLTYYSVHRHRGVIIGNQNGGHPVPVGTRSPKLQHPDARFLELIWAKLLAGAILIFVNRAWPNNSKKAKKKKKKSEAQARKKKKKGHSTTEHKQIYGSRRVSNYCYPFAPESDCSSDRGIHRFYFWNVVALQWLYLNSFIVTKRRRRKKKAQECKFCASCYMLHSQWDREKSRKLGGDKHQTLTANVSNTHFVTISIFI